MDSSATLSGRAQMVPKECDVFSPARSKHPSSRRTPSFSSSSSLSSSSSSISYYPDDSLLSPATPFRFSGVPFSWEHLPGIPKKLQSHKKKESVTVKLLPLPPPATTPTSKRHNFIKDIGTQKKLLGSSDSFSKDPFFAAMVECSKDGDDDDHQDSSGNMWTGAKVSRSISDRFGFVNLYTSCKRTCAVSESIVYLPRSSRTSYGLISHHRSR